MLQYNINNTLPHTVLQDISVIAQPDNELYQEDFIVPLAELKPDQTGIVYVSFSAPAIEDEELLSAFGNTVALTKIWMMKVMLTQQTMVGLMNTKLMIWNCWLVTL